MKLLIAGAWKWPFYEQACANALTRLGVDVERFEWTRYFDCLSGRLQAKLPFPGLALLRMNADLVNCAKDLRPDVIFVWRGTHVLPRTLRTLKAETGALLVSYNNDDPIGSQTYENLPWYNNYYWFWYLKCVPFYDVHFVYRQINVPEIIAAGAKKAHVMMPYFIPELHHPLKLTSRDKDKYKCDVVFVGHYESDGRDQFLRALVRAGLNVRLFGGGRWTRSALGDMADYFGEVYPALNHEYTKALCGAKMCLNFLSKMNRDTYTRRCFEIPACRGLLLSERTGDLQRMFKENEEACFFSSPEELVEKALWLKKNPETIEKVAAAGLRRVHLDRHSVDDRMREFMLVVEQITRER